MQKESAWKCITKTVTTLHQAIQKNKNIMNYQIYTEQSQIPKHSVVATEKNDSLFLAQIVKPPVLVFRHNEMSCQSCVDALIGAFSKAEMLNDYNIMLLTYYSNPIFLQQFKRINHLSLPIYNIKNTYLLPDSLNLPYFFILHEDLTVSNVFIPEEGDTNGVNNYLTFIGKKQWQ